MALRTPKNSHEQNLRAGNSRIVWPQHAAFVSLDEAMPKPKYFAERNAYAARYDWLRKQSAPPFIDDDVWGNQEKLDRWVDAGIIDDQITKGLSK